MPTYTHLPATVDFEQAKPYVERPEARFINRELSWLAFNSRVLEEARNPRNPLLERLKFLSISASNLDEFTMVRIAGLKDQLRHGVSKKSDDGLSVAQQLDQMLQAVTTLSHNQQAVWVNLRRALKSAGLHVIERDDLKPAEKQWLYGYFMENIFPVLTPIAVDPAHPFPFLPNLGIALLYRLLHTGAKKKEQVAIISLPQKLDRFIHLPATPGKTNAREPRERHRFIRLEDVVTLFLDAFFPGYRLLDSAAIRILRDGDLEVEDEAEDLMRSFERAVQQRRRGRVIRVKAHASISPFLLQFVLEHLHVGTEEVELVEGVIGLAHLMELYAYGAEEDRFPNFTARSPERIQDFNGDCFAAIAAKDIVVHHPFESFDVVVQFLRQAANDPDVVSIKQTLYRTSDDSPIVKALIEAAERGKSVTALVELKARFDEEANIRWARDLERVGVQVVYGFVKLKTHAKVSLVVRRTDAGLKSYVHLGTGNYHPKTARFYTDLSFFTANPEICRDVAYLFNYMTGNATPRTLSKLVLAPKDLRPTVSGLIAQEIINAKAGKPAQIWAKMNSLVDPEIVDLLYDASQAGVQVRLIVRGMCILRPGVPGMSENIRVKSVVGRFLEHSRIFCFANGVPLPSREAKVYLASADWMVRNFDWRVEAMVPLENPTVHAQVLDQIMMAYLQDDLQSWELQPDGSYKRTEPEGDGFCAHDYFLANPSLSGRGKALKKTGAPLSPGEAREKRAAKKKKPEIRKDEGGATNPEKAGGN
jgi:polyphosphate kinase